MQTKKRKATCERCGKNYIREHPAQKYCTEAACAKARATAAGPKMKEAKCCQNCGTAYSTARGWSRFCSKLCRQAWWNKATQAGKQALTSKVDWDTVKAAPADPALYHLSLDSGNDPGEPKPSKKRTRAPRKIPAPI